MNIVAVEALAYAITRISLFAFLGSFAACWAGRFMGEMSFHGVWLFVRRSPRWRRFGRAMRKVMA
ncbi:hypothetical protein AB4076_11630 [Dyella sp. 2RAF44]|uniref:hypothetical protein n=1 Tax=Dyella sp. 2RAF44 TaxID=3233000 RepID=UPI003F90649F